MKYILLLCLASLSSGAFAQTKTTVKTAVDSVTSKVSKPVSKPKPTSTTTATAAKSLSDSTGSKVTAKAVASVSNPKTSADSTASKANSVKAASVAKTITETLKTKTDSLASKSGSVTALPLKTEPVHISVTSLKGLKVYDAKDELFYLDSLSQGKPTVVVFFSVKCLVSGLYNERFNELYNDYIQKATFVFINSNDEESWNEIQKYFKDNSLIFDLVKDKGKATANALNVTKIPTAFIFKSDGTIAYRGKIDNNPRVQGTIYGSQLQVNLDKVINGEELSVKESVAVGCDLNKPEKPAPKPTAADTSNDQ